MEIIQSLVLIFRNFRHNIGSRFIKHLYLISLSEMAVAAASWVCIKLTKLNAILHNIDIIVFEVMLNSQAVTLINFSLV